MAIKSNLTEIETCCCWNNRTFLFTVKAATLIFISGRGLAISSAKEGKPGSIYNLVKS